jgi:small subunit ribosomal protein S16
MIKIRLKRQGRKRQPHYRVIVCDSRIRRQGSPIEEIGYYNPRHKILKLDKEKALEWISKGASPSETVQKLIESCGEDGNFSPEALEYRKTRKAKIKEQKKAAEAKKAEEASDEAEKATA